MEKEFVTYELALRLKALGFDEPCFGRYDGRGKSKGKIWCEMPNSGQYTIPVGDVLAPTWQSAFDWFGEKYQLYASVVVDQTSYPKYAFEIAKFVGNPKDLTEKEWYWDDMILSPNLYRTKTEARLYCLTELLNVVEEKLWKI
jgi:hypothetical protein